MHQNGPQIFVDAGVEKNYNHHKKYTPLNFLKYVSDEARSFFVQFAIKFRPLNHIIVSTLIPLQGKICLVSKNIIIEGKKVNTGFSWKENSCPCKGKILNNSFFCFMTCFCLLVVWVDLKEKSCKHDKCLETLQLHWNKYCYAWNRTATTTRSYPLQRKDKCGRGKKIGNFFSSIFVWGVESSCEKVKGHVLDLIGIKRTSSFNPRQLFSSDGIERINSNFHEKVECKKMKWFCGLRENKMLQCTHQNEAWI